MNNPRLKNRETLDLLKKDWQRQMAEKGVETTQMSLASFDNRPGMAVHAFRSKIAVEEPISPIHRVGRKRRCSLGH